MKIHPSIGICTPIPFVESAVPGEKMRGHVTPEWQRARGSMLYPVGHSCAEIYIDGQEVGVARAVVPRPVECQ